jgi:hypothetical protein
MNGSLSRFMLVYMHVCTSPRYAFTCRWTSKVWMHQRVHSMHVSTYMHNTRAFTHMHTHEQIEYAWNRQIDMHTLIQAKRLARSCALRLPQRTPTLWSCPWTSSPWLVVACLYVCIYVRKHTCAWTSYIHAEYPTYIYFKQSAMHLPCLWGQVSPDKTCPKISLHRLVLDSHVSSTDSPLEQRLEIRREPEKSVVKHAA